MVDLQVAQRVGADIPAQAVVLIARTVVRFGGIDRVATDFGLMGFGEGVRVDDLFAVPLALR